MQAPPLPRDKRLSDKVIVVVGAGQTPGETLGNGRATSILFARHGARLLLVDRDPESAEETAETIRGEGGTACVLEADVLDEDACRQIPERCAQEYGRLDVLHYNVGVGGGGNGMSALEAADWERIHDVNARGAFFCAKHALPVMKEQRSGCLIFVSSVAASAAVGMMAYKTSKASLNALAHGIAAGNARHGIRCNVISPGLMDTPMAIEGFSKARGLPREQIRAERDALVPLTGGMGSAWDIAHAALFLASDEARFITGVDLPVDGGQLTQIG